MHRLWRIAALVMMAILIAGCGSPSSSGQKAAEPGSQRQGATQPAPSVTEVKVGVITPQTGPVAFLGQDVTKGARLAADEINAAGGIKALGGARLTLVFADSQGKPDTAANEMQRLASSEKVALVVGGDSSGGTAGGAQAAEQLGIPYLNSSATDIKLLERGYKWYFSDQLTSDDIARAVVDFANHLVKDLGLPNRVAILHEDSGKGKGDADSFEKLAARLQLSVVTRQSYNVQSRDLGPVMNRLKQANPAIMLWSGYTEDQAAGIKALDQIEFYPYLIGGGSGLSDPRMVQLVGTELLDKFRASASAYYSPLLPRPAAKAFRDAYQARYKEEATQYASLGYKGVYVAKAVLEAAGSTDRAAIVNGLKKVNIPGDQTVTPFDYIRFNASGRNEGARALIAQWQKGKLELVWPTSVQTAKASR